MYSSVTVLAVDKTDRKCAGRDFCLPLLEQCLSYNPRKAAICDGRSIMSVAPLAMSCSPVRNPQLTDRQSIPAFFAVAMSTSESPT